MSESPASRLEQYLWPRGVTRDVWAILDGARDRRVYGFLLDSYLNYSCLYAGTLAPELEVAAPYLVQLEHDDKYTRELLELAWGNSWGVFLNATSAWSGCGGTCGRFSGCRISGAGG